MSSKHDSVIALPGFRDGGSMTVDQVAAELGISEKQAEALLYKVVIRGGLRRWPGIAGQPATYHRPGPAKSIVTERFGT